MTAPVPAPDRDRETREAEAREEIARVPSFEDMLRDPNEQFDLRSELLASIDRYMNAPSATMSAPRPAARETGGAPIRPNPSRGGQQDWAGPTAYPQAPHQVPDGGPTDEAREEIARTLYEHDRKPDDGPPWDDDLLSDQLLGLRTAYREAADAVLALPALRTVREHDALRRDLAALAEEWEREAKSAGMTVARAVPRPDPATEAAYAMQAGAARRAAARVRALLDGGEGGR